MVLLKKVKLAGCPIIRLCQATVRQQRPLNLVVVVYVSLQEPTYFKRGVILLDLCCEIIWMVQILCLDLCVVGT